MCVCVTKHYTGQGAVMTGDAVALWVERRTNDQ